MDEALRMSGVGGVEPRLTHGHELVDMVVEHVGRRKQRQRRMLMMMVVPAEELGTPGACMLSVAEASGEIGLSLKRLKLRRGCAGGSSITTPWPSRPPAPCSPQRTNYASACREKKLP